MSLLEEFMENVAGSNNTILDFEPKINSSGQFSKISQLNVVLRSWSNILITPVRSYNFDPEYGSILYNYVFSMLDERTRRSIEREISYKLSHYDNRASIESIEISDLPNRKGFSININAEFKGEFGNIIIDFDERLYNSQN